VKGFGGIKANGLVGIHIGTKKDDINLTPKKY
jgi:hypothetical protein